jgi:hypothetical protein
VGPRRDYDAPCPQAAVARAVAKEVSGAGKYAAYAAAQAVAVAHVSAHHIGAAPTPSGLRTRRPARLSANSSASKNADGSANSCPTISENSFLMTSDFATLHVGSCPTADQHEMESASRRRLTGG